MNTVSTVFTTGTFLSLSRQLAVLSLRLRRLSTATAAGFFFFSPTTLRANDSDQIKALKSMSLEELTSLRVDTVIGASKHEQKVGEAPANVSIITAEDIKHHGWRTLGEVLRSVTGFYVTYDRGYAYLGSRGINRPGDFGGRTLITIDGHRLNDPIFDTAAMDTDFLLDLALIEKIEVIRGPGSSLYGNNAFFAVINIITRQGKDVHGGEVAGSYGTFDTYTGRLSYGNTFTNGVGMLLSGTIYGSGGNPNLFFPEFTAVNNGVAKNMDDGRSQSGFVNLTWKDFSLEGGYVNRMKRWPTAPYSADSVLTVFNDPTFHTTDERSFLELKFHHTFASDWELATRAYYDHYRFDGWYPFNYTPTNLLNPTTVNYDYANSESFGGEVQVSRQVFAHHRLTMGTEFRLDPTLDQVDSDLAPHAVYNNSRANGYLFALFAEDEFQIATNLILNAGVRYDHFRSFGDTVNPRAALIYHPWEPSTFKLLYGQAFRAPNAYEEFYQTASYTASQGLKPETVRSYELVYEHQFPGGIAGKISGFYNDISDLINLDELPGGNFSFQNSGTATATGFESELTANLGSGLRGSVSYTFTRTRDGKTGDLLDNSPEHLAKLNLSIPVWRQKVFASAEVQAMSERRTGQAGSVGAFWVVNATIYSRALVKNLELSISLYNLLDHHYSDPVSADFTQSSVQQNGRTLRLNATWHF